MYRRDDKELLNMFWKQRDSFREKGTRQQEISANVESDVKFIKETVLVGLLPQQKTEIEKLIERDFSIYERLLKELEDYKFDKYIKVLNDSIEEWRKINLSQSDSLNKWKETYLEKERKDETLNNLIKTVKEKSGEAEKLFGSPKNEFEREIEELHYKFLDNRNRLIEILLDEKELNAKVISTTLSCWQMAILSVEREIDSVIRKKQFYRFALHSILISIAILLTVYNITLLPIAIVFVIISNILVGRWVTPWLEKPFKLKLSKLFRLIINGKIMTKLFFHTQKKILDELSLRHEDTYEHGTNKVS
jgi:hypothetical protein